LLFAFVYLLLRRLFLEAADSSNQLNSDIELVVLRHQLKVLKRQVGKPRLRGRARLLLAALSSMLPRPLVLVLGQPAERSRAPLQVPAAQQEYPVQALSPDCADPPSRRTRSLVGPGLES
jgi:hypothetical protein